MIASDFSAATALLTAMLITPLSLLVVWAFRRSIRWPGRNSGREDWIMHGVAWAFISDVLNSTFWGVKWVLVLVGEHEMSDHWSSYGGFVDPLTKGPTAWAAICHLVAAGYVAAMLTLARRLIK